MTNLTLLSMGWGVQTWTLAAMMALKELEHVNFIVFADTHHEGQATYAFIRDWTPWLVEHGLNVVTVEGKRTDVIREDWSKSVMIPAFTVAAADGAQGQVHRQCTHDWKIMPIRQFVRQELAWRGLKPISGVVQMQLGISLDEFQRMRDSDVAYITNTYPLVDKRMRRVDCIAWLERTGLPIPPKSACTFCPYRSIMSWQELKRQGGADWQEAVAVDEMIRNKRPHHGQLFVHPHRKPLPVAIMIPEDEGSYQISFDDVCDGGVCGV